MVAPRSYAAGVIGPFHFSPPARRVAFGEGNLAEVVDEVARFGTAFVVATPGEAELAARVGELVGAGEPSRFTGAAPHTPTSVTEVAGVALEASGADCVVSVGGGSATGLAKALALRSGLPVVAVPTTYAGSEMTGILGQSEGRRKWTQRDDALRPASVVYDVALTYGLPRRQSAASGCNALAHAVEALWARDASPVHLLVAEEAIAVVTEALPLVVADPAGPEGRQAALYGAFLAGMCLDACEMALHHRICHVLGGRFDLPHAETHAAVLPHVVAYYGPGEPADRLGEALGVAPKEVGEALYELLGRLGLPRALRELGLPEEGPDEAASLLVEAGGYNPVPISTRTMAALLGRAARGERPAPHAG